MVLVQGSPPIVVTGGFDSLTAAEPLLWPSVAVKQSRHLFHWLLTISQHMGTEPLPIAIVEWQGGPPNHVAQALFTAVFSVIPNFYHLLHANALLSKRLEDDSQRVRCSYSCIFISERCFADFVSSPVFSCMVRY